MDGAGSNTIQIQIQIQIQIKIQANLAAEYMQPAVCFLTEWMELAHQRLMDGSARGHRDQGDPYLNVFIL